MAWVRGYFSSCKGKKAGFEATTLVKLLKVWLLFSMIDFLIRLQEQEAIAFLFDYIISNQCTNKSDITCQKTSRETFTYNMHNSAQAKLTADIELQIIVCSYYLCYSRQPTETEKQLNAVYTAKVLTRQFCRALPVSSYTSRKQVLRLPTRFSPCRQCTITFVCCSLAYKPPKAALYSSRIVTYDVIYCAPDKCGRTNKQTNKQTWKT